MSKKPDVKSSFTFRDQLFHIDWYDIHDGELPDLPWQQVYAIGDVDGLVPIVHYPGDDNDNLPGGRSEPGETIEQTLVRELDEEIKAKVISWYPLGYQDGINTDGKRIYQLRVYAKLTIDDKFVKDPGGSVIGHSLVPLEELNQHIKWGEIGDRLVDMVLRLKK